MDCIVTSLLIYIKIYKVKNQVCYFPHLAYSLAASPIPLPAILCCLAIASTVLTPKLLTVVADLWSIESYFQIIVCVLAVPVHAESY